MQVTTNGLSSFEPKSGCTGKCTLGGFSLCGTQMPAYDFLSCECTLGSFFLPSTAHKRRLTGSLHLNLRIDAKVNILLVVSLYQARNTDASLRISLILRTFVPLVVFLCRARNTNSDPREDEI